MVRRFANIAVWRRYVSAAFGHAELPDFWNISMLLTDLVAPNGVIPALKVTARSRSAGSSPPRRPELSARASGTVLEILEQREKLGSTASATALPFRRQAAQAQQAFGLFARLDRPVDFEALDGQPVVWCSAACARRQPAPIISRRWPRLARSPARFADVARKLRDSRDAEALLRCAAMPSASAADRGGEKSKPVGNPPCAVARCDFNAS